MALLQLAKPIHDPNEDIHLPEYDDLKELIGQFKYLKLEISKLNTPDITDQERRERLVSWKSRVTRLLIQAKDCYCLPTSLSKVIKHESAQADMDRLCELWDDSILPWVFGEAKSFVTSVESFTQKDILKSDLTQTHTEIPTSLNLVDAVNLSLDAISLIIRRCQSVETLPSESKIIRDMQYHLKVAALLRDFTSNASSTWLMLKSFLHNPNSPRIPDQDRVDKVNHFIFSLEHIRVWLEKHAESHSTIKYREELFYLYGIRDILDNALENIILQKDYIPDYELDDSFEYNQIQAFSEALNNQIRRHIRDLECRGISSEVITKDEMHIPQYFHLNPELVDDDSIPMMEEEFLRRCPKPYDLDSDSWLTSKKAAEYDGISTDTLKIYRNKRGWKSEDGNRGLDCQGRIWIRPTTTEKAHPLYLKDSLKNYPAS